MKKSGLFAASVAAASATAISVSPSCDPNRELPTKEDKKDQKNSSNKRSPSTEKFAPRFDGLRFIETLVTAHR